MSGRPDETRRFALPGTAYHLVGGDFPGEGPLLVYLHGLGCTGSVDWPPVARSTALSGRASRWFDLLGFGRSERPRDFSYDLGELAEVLASLLMQEDRPQALVGHSMGGTLALFVAEALVRAGRPPQALVLAEPNLRAEDATGSAVAAATPLDFFVARWEAWVASSPPGLYREDLRLADPVAFHRSAVSLVRLGRELIPRLAALPVPVRGYILGGRSEAVTHETARQVAAAGVPVVTVAASGHMFSEDDPEGFGRAIAQLLSRLG